VDASPDTGYGVTSSESGLELRAAVLRLGPWVGWASMVAIFAGLFLVAPAHRGALLLLALAAAVLNTSAMFLPWRDWLERAQGRFLVDLWSAALIGFVALLVAVGGPNFSLLLFLTVPFIALVQVGLRRRLWLGASGATCLLVSAVVGVPAGVTAMRIALLAATVAVALGLASMIEREAAAHRRALERAELERSLAVEANHRIKNNLQTVADLLLLVRPTGRDGRVFDETAGRIHSIAALHRLLAEGGDATVDSAALLASIARTAPLPVAVDAGHFAFDSATAQKVGLVANELITNAARHGAEPITVSLDGANRLVLRVDDGGRLIAGPSGLGLELVRRIVENGLGGRFGLQERPGGGGTRAEVVFPR
jgi:two-component sensor histidine kinase